MDADTATKAGRAPAVKAGGMRIPAKDHSVPVVRKEHGQKAHEKDGSDEDNEEQDALEKAEKMEYEKQTRLAAGERLARMHQNQPRHEPTNNFRQKENIQVVQPILHTHQKSGSALQQQ